MRSKKLRMRYVNNNGYILPQLPPSPPTAMTQTTKQQKNMVDRLKSAMTHKKKRNTTTIARSNL